MKRLIIDISGQDKNFSIFPNVPYNIFSKNEKRTLHVFSKVSDQRISIKNSKGTIIYQSFNNQKDDQKVLSLIDELFSYMIGKSDRKILDILSDLSKCTASNRYVIYSRILSEENLSPQEKNCIFHTLAKLTSISDFLSLFLFIEFSKMFQFDILAFMDLFPSLETIPSYKNTFPGENASKIPDEQILEKYTEFISEFNGDIIRGSTETEPNFLSLIAISSVNGTYRKVLEQNISWGFKFLVAFILDRITWHFYYIKQAVLFFSVLYYMNYKNLSSDVSEHVEKCFNILSKIFSRDFKEKTNWLGIDEEVDQMPKMVEDVLCTMIDIGWDSFLLFYLTLNGFNRPEYMFSVILKLRKENLINSRALFIVLLLCSKNKVIGDQFAEYYEKNKQKLIDFDEHLLKRIDSMAILKSRLKDGFSLDNVVALYKEYE